jgi:hypothetical protein
MDDTNWKGICNDTDAEESNCNPLFHNNCNNLGVNYCSTVLLLVIVEYNHKVSVSNNSKA